jgi:hypothetical protein
LFSCFIYAKAVGFYSCFHITFPRMLRSTFRTSL